MRSLSAYQDTLMRNPVLRYIFFELTDCCNMKCLHCGSSCEPRKSTFLSRSVIERTLRSIVREYDPHDIMVCLTGGEPLLHPDLCADIHHDQGSCGNRECYAGGDSESGPACTENELYN